MRRQPTDDPLYLFVCGQGKRRSWTAARRFNALLDAREAQGIALARGIFGDGSLVEQDLLDRAAVLFALDRDVSQHLEATFRLGRAPIDLEIPDIYGPKDLMDYENMVPDFTLRLMNERKYTRLYGEDFWARDELLLEWPLNDVLDARRLEKYVIR